MENLTIVCADGIPLTAWHFKAEGDVKGVIQINPATAVVSAFYQPFAAYLASQGWHTIGYDYRGSGASQHHKLDPKKIGFSTWANQDVGDVTRFAHEHFKGLPHFALGHSFGGHAVGFNDSSNLLQGAVLVASHAGCWRHVRGVGERVKVMFLLKVLLPTVGLFTDVIPGRKLGIGDDLPAGVAFEWSKWTSMKNYFFDDPQHHAAERFARVQIPLLSIGIDDDPWAPPKAIDVIANAFTGTHVERWQRGPKHSNNKAIGHMGFFRKVHRDTLWPEIDHWFTQRL